MNLILAATDPLSHVLPHRLHEDPIFSVHVGGEGSNIPALFVNDGVYEFFITNHLSMSFLAAVLVILTFTYVANRVKPSGKGLEAYKTKGRLAQLLEMMCTFIRDEVVRPNLGALTDKYIYYVWTVFFFVLFANVLGLIPLGYMLQSVTGNTHLSHWGGTATGNLSLNVMLALCSFIAILFIGIRETGLKAFLAHFNPLGWGDPKMLAIGLPLYALEWMGLLIKCTVLAMRLFGTMMAGHLVIAAFIGLVFLARDSSHSLGYAVEFLVIAGGIVLTLLELFICFLQAFIFTFLTVLFISMVAHHQDHDHEYDHDTFSDEGQMYMDKLIDPSRITPMSSPA
jgi:F-type H+-transporting ATPase subunit a